MGGWKLTGIVSVQSGFPMGLTQTGGQAFSGGRPNYVSSVKPLTSGSTHQRLGGSGDAYLNPAAFRLSQSFELGDVPRSAAALRSPLTFQDDVSAIKNFAIYESLSGEFGWRHLMFSTKYSSAFRIRPSDLLHSVTSPHKQTFHATYKRR